MFSRTAAFTPARPEEILRPVNGWFILLTFLLALLANLGLFSPVMMVFSTILLGPADWDWLERRYGAHFRANLRIFGHARWYAVSLFAESRRSSAAAATRS